MTKRTRAYLFLIAVAAIWGAAGPVIKFTLKGIDPFPFLAYRFSISAAFSLIFFSIKGFKLPKKFTHKVHIGIYGFLATSLALGLLFTGLNKTTVLDLTLIGTVGPLLIVAGGALFFRDRITHKEKLGISIVLLGVIINSFIPIFTNGAGARLTGNVFLVLFLLSDSAAVLVAKKVVRERVPSIRLTNYAFIIGALTMVPFASLNYGAGNFIDMIVTMPLKYHLGVWYMALASGTLAYYLSVRGYKSIEVSEATLFNYLQPLFAVPLAIFWLGEKLTNNFLVGAAFILTGLFIAESKKQRKIAR